MVAEAAAPKSKQSATRAAKAKREEMIRMNKEEVDKETEKKDTATATASDPSHPAQNPGPTQ